tara:strand:+ start:34 stop:480 length:447 start_codon:yes stop_codon:yes gene_type:complete
MTSKEKQKRIFHIAKELNISHIEIMKFLELKNVEVKSHMAPVPAETYELILNEFSKEKKSIERLRKEKARQAVVSGLVKPELEKENLEEIKNKKILKTNNAEVKLTITKKADPKEKIFTKKHDKDKSKDSAKKINTLSQNTEEDKSID